MITINTKEYQLPMLLPFGWRTAVAKAIGVHRNTIYNVMKEGESHELYAKIMHVLTIKYGIPINKEVDNDVI